METLFTKKQYLQILQKIEGSVYCFSDLAKEFFEAGDFEALHRIVVGNQEWLRELGIIKEKLSGVGESWHSNGQLSSRGTYDAGKAHGAWEYFNDNGHPWMRGTFNLGWQHGVWEYFYENGQIWRRDTYANGRLIKVETF